MANRITDEQKIQINELYYQLGVKSQVAKRLGISAASVSKYIIEGYVPQSQKVEITFDKEPSVFSFSDFKNNKDLAFFLTNLSSEEKKELEELQKEIFI